MATHKVAAFTLIELLIVITIILLLVTILTPALGQALELSRRAACGVNLKDLVRACRTYALTGREHRGSLVRCLPRTRPTTGNWFSPGGNRAGLWLLVKYEYASPRSFVCPSLSNFEPAEIEDNEFKDRTCGYSYHSMVDRAVTLDKLVNLSDASKTYPVYPSLTILADLNPRFKVGTNAPRFNSQDVFNIDPPGPKPSFPKSVDLPHEDIDGTPAGQNVGNLDGSVSFKRSPVVATLRPRGGGSDKNPNDWIYDSTSPGGDSSGKCQDSSRPDVFLLN